MAKKRLILGLALCFLVLLGALAGRLWYVSFYGLDKLSRYIFFCLVLTFFLFVLVALLGVAGVVLVILCHRPIPVFDAPINILITKLLPLSMYAGRLFRVAKQKLERSFIEINNTLVRARKLRFHPNGCLSWPRIVYNIQAAGSKSQLMSTTAVPAASARLRTYFCWPGS